MVRICKFNFIAVMVSMLLISILFSGCGDNYDKNVQMVREGTLYVAPDIPIGKAFDQFFANGKWKSFESTDNQLVVEFNGDCTWYNAPAKMKVQFVINGNEFNVYHVGINDVPMDELDSFGIVAKILEEYKN